MPGQVDEVVGPGASAGRNGAPTAVLEDGAKVFVPLGDHAPDGACELSLAHFRGDIDIASDLASEACGAGQRCQDLFEIEVAVGEVGEDEATGSQLGAIDVERLPGEQVDGHDIGAEGVDDDESVSMVGRVLDAPAGVTEDDLSGVCRGVRQVVEPALIVGDGGDGGVEFVENPAFAGQGIGCEGSDAQADDGDGGVTIAEEGPDHAEDVPDGALARVVGARFAAEVGVEGLLAVEGGAVHQSDGLRLVLARDVQAAQKGAMAPDGTSGRAIDEEADGEHRGEGEEEGEGPDSMAEDDEEAEPAGEGEERDGEGEERWRVVGGGEGGGRGSADGECEEEIAAA